jgi:hypothetical protein
MKMVAFMMKVRIVFPTLLQLWDFKQIFRKRVLKTSCLKRSLICVCSEAEIELAIHGYNAKVLSADEKDGKNSFPQQDHGFTKSLWLLFS